MALSDAGTPPEDTCSSQAFNPKILPFSQESVEQERRPFITVLKARTRILTHMMPAPTSRLPPAVTRNTSARTPTQVVDACREKRVIFFQFVSQCVYPNPTHTAPKHYPEELEDLSTQTTRMAGSEDGKGAKFDACAVRITEEDVEMW